MEQCIRKLLLSPRYDGVEALDNELLLLGAVFRVAT